MFQLSCSSIPLLATYLFWPGIVTGQKNLAVLRNAKVHMNYDQLWVKKDPLFFQNIFNFCIQNYEPIFFQGFESCKEKWICTQKVHSLSPFSTKQEKHHDNYDNLWPLPGGLIWTYIILKKFSKMMLRPLALFFFLEKIENDSIWLENHTSKKWWNAL